jgi:TolB protein
MRRTSRHLLITMVLAATALTTAGLTPARATAPGHNGRIAFRKYFNDAHTRGAIFTIRPDGSGLIQVTHRGRVLLDTAPDWSPDGRWIAFYRDARGKPYRIFKVRANGADMTKLSEGPSHSFEDFFPSWSPNGKRIAFTRDDGSGPALFVMRSDGTHVREVSGTQSRRAQFAQWSPDGTQLVFQGERADGSGGEAIFTIRLDGTHVRRLTPWKLHAGDGPDWSPDGRWIVLESHDEQDRPDNVFLVHPNGSDLHRITTSPQLGGHQWGHYSFSPNGTMIVISHNLGEGSDADIYVMNLDGSGLRKVTDSRMWESAPDWGSRPSG